MAQRYRKKRNRTARKIMGVLLLCLLSALVGFYGVKAIMTGGQESPEAVSPPEEEESALGPVEQSPSQQETTQPADPPADAPTVPAMDDPEEMEPEPPAASETVLSVTTKAYAWQLGSFSTRANAERFVDMIQGKGGTGLVMEKEGFKVVHRLYGSPSLDDAHGAAAKELVREAFKTSFERQWSVTVSPEEADKIGGWLEAFRSVFESIAPLEEAYAKREEGTLSEQALAERLKAFERSLEDVRRRLEAEQAGEDVARNLMAFYEDCSSVLSVERAGEKAPWEDLSDLYTLGLNCLEEGE